MKASSQELDSREEAFTAFGVAERGREKRRAGTRGVKGVGLSGSAR
ncbi:hypothetical protein BJY18_003892 [Amycolatopsis jiangsuensis]|uniref:Uncharacterized protein n=1 Tax=Amycolatopsis jiangsuensis TaxID=1181879 RepID=A0A840IYP1_9PSEU|nr:hypothetical protein [Amycolatopsis jiangsuensis]